MEKISHNRKKHAGSVKELGEKGRRLEAEKDILLQAALSLNEAFEASEIMRRLVSYAIELAEAESGTWGIFEDGKIIITEYNVAGNVKDIFYEFQAGYGVPGWIIENQKPYISNNTERDRHVVPEIQKELGFYNLVDVPIISRRGELLGCFEIHNTKDKRPFDEQDVDVLEKLASLAAVALENAKLFEEALLGSETRFRQLFDNMGSGVAVYGAVDDGADFVFKDINKAGADLTKVKREDIIGKRVTEVFPTIKEMGLVEEFKKVWKSGKSLHYPTAQYLDQRLSVWFENDVYKLPTGEIVAIFANRTEEKLTQNVLDLQRYYLQKAQEIAKVGAWSFDMNSNRITCTDEVYHIFGVPPGTELTYKDYLRCVHPEDRQYVTAKWKMDLGKESYDIEHRIIVKGDVKWVRARAEVQISEEGQALWPIGAVQDITERIMAEEALRKSEEKYRLLNAELEKKVVDRTRKLAMSNVKLLKEVVDRRRLEKELLTISENERRRIGQELHDSLGQQLTGIGFMTKALEQKLSATSLPGAEDAGEIAMLINTTTAQARALAKGLHPMELDAGGFISAMEELAESTELVFGVNCRFNCEKAVPVDDPNVAINIYRIAQEAVTNAIKHGKPENIMIELSSENEMSTLTIENDGERFPEVLIEQKGIGIQIMGYRAEMIDGELDIHCRADGGTVVICSFPNKG